MRAPPAPKRRRAVLPWLCSRTGPVERCPRPRAAATVSPSGMPGLDAPGRSGTGGRAQQPQAEDGAAMRVDPRRRGQHGRLGLEPDDPQPPHPAAARAGLGQAAEIGLDGGGAGAERGSASMSSWLPRSTWLTKAGLRPGLQFQEQACTALGRDRSPIRVEPRHGREGAGRRSRHRGGHAGTLAEKKALPRDQR